jgi:hypothetical protein
MACVRGSIEAYGQWCGRLRPIWADRGCAHLLNRAKTRAGYVEPVKKRPDRPVSRGARLTNRRSRNREARNSGKPLLFRGPWPALGETD